jgi:hypothetical protein
MPLKHQLICHRQTYRGCHEGTTRFNPLSKRSSALTKPSMPLISGGNIGTARLTKPSTGPDSGTTSFDVIGAESLMIGVDILADKDKKPVASLDSDTCPRNLIISGMIGARPSTVLIRLFRVFWRDSIDGKKPFGREPIKGSDIFKAGTRIGAKFTFSSSSKISMKSAIVIPP